MSIKEGHKIKLPSGEYTMISMEDVSQVCDHKWYLVPRKRSGPYARGCIEGKQILLHRFIMAAPIGLEVDHINGDSLDNRRPNLRLCTPAQNCWNTRSKSRCSRFKGIWRNHKKWSARVTVHGIRHYLGSFTTEEEAALAYNKGARKHFGEFAQLNEVDDE